MKDILRRNVFLSTAHRDTSIFPSASTFTVFLPATLNNIFGVRVRTYKYTPEPLINANSKSIPYLSSSGAGTLTLATGDHNQSLPSLISAVNTLLSSHNVRFVINSAGFASLEFIGTSSNFFVIYKCRLLQLLGFTNGIWLYRTGHAPGSTSVPVNATTYETQAIGTVLPTAVNNTDLILQITNLEAILSSDGVCNRATAILVSSRTPAAVSQTCEDGVNYLLQVQHRLQQLRVSILDSNGDPYDFGTDNASFMLEFYCYNETSC